jgi:hypothetical protein
LNVARRAGIGALVAWLWLPHLAVLVLIGIATNWWIAGLIAGGTFGLLALAYAASRSRGVLGEAFGTGGRDPLDSTYWTPRYLFLKPLVISLPASAAVIAAAVITASSSYMLTAAVAVPGFVIGLALGAWLWLWLEKRRGGAS